MLSLGGLLRLLEVDVFDVGVVGWLVSGLTDEAIKVSCGSRPAAQRRFQFLYPAGPV